MKEFSIAVLISGGGTTLRNLIEKRRDSQLNAQIKLVISSHANAGGLTYAEAAEIPAVVCDFKKWNTASSMSDEVFRLCRDAGIDLVVLGGFLRKLEIPDDFENRVINIHPSLIPAFCGKGFYGIKVHRAVIEKGSKLSGCTVHFVDNHYDHGPIIAQRSVPVQNDDSPDSLAAKIFEQECEVYPEVINAIARGEVRVSGDEVWMQPADSRDSS